MKLLFSGLKQLKSFKDASSDGEWEAFKEFPSMKELVQEKVGVDLSDVRGAVLPAAKKKEIYNRRGEPSAGRTASILKSCTPKPGTA